MNILIVGRSGQVARSLVERASQRTELRVTTLGRPEIDLERPGDAGRAIRERAPDLVINAAAYTAVDRAEDEPDRAFRINAAAAGEIAEAASIAGCPVIYLSTDYVFDGSGSAPLVETHPVGPINVYGSSKLAGEDAVRAATEAHLVLRTSWVYSPFGSNFVKTMLRLGTERDEIAVVADQYGCPTSALDLGGAILTVADQWRIGSRVGLGQVFHLAGREPCSWFDFAGEIFEAAGSGTVVRPIGTSDYPTRAVRPLNSVLDSGQFEVAFNFAMPPRARSLSPVLARLVEERSRRGG